MIFDVLLLNPEFVILGRPKGEPGIHSSKFGT